MQNEIETSKLRQIVTHHRSAYQTDEMLRHSLRSQVLGQGRIIFWIIREHPDIGDVALVTGAGVRDFSKPHQTTRRSTSVWTNSHKKNNKTKTTNNHTKQKTPPPPAGPFV